MSVALTDAIYRVDGGQRDADGANQRVPPHSIEAEHSVLGALLMDNGAWPEVATTLQAGHFYQHEHRLIFGALATMMSQGQVADVITVAEHFERNGGAEQVGGLVYLDQLRQCVCSASAIGAHAAIVRDCATSRQAIALHDRAKEGHFKRDQISLRDAGEATRQALLLLEDANEPQRLQAHTLNLVDLASHPQDPPAFVIPEWLPEGCVTLLAAHGEGGKSQIGLLIAICIAAGLPVLGTPPRPPRRVLFYSCEDGLPILNWRVQQYCSALGITPDTLDGWLFVVDAADLDDPELFEEQRGTVGRLTRSYQELRALMAAEAIDIVVIDNASDTYAANEISRPAVRAFIRSLRHLLPSRHTGAVLLLAHVNRAASVSNTAGQQWSGSTQWHNSVRSRWELTRRKADAEQEDDDDDAAGPPAPYILKRAKGNYAPAGGTGLHLHWDPRHGVILPDEQPGPAVVHAIEHPNDERILLKGFAAARMQGQRISSSLTANNNAARILAIMVPDLPKRLREMKKLNGVLQLLQARGLLAIAEYLGSNGTSKRLEWVLTDQGRTAAAAQAWFAPASAPASAEQGAGA
ncbi:AAA family ATPase [Variovorax sp. J22P240]|uniref:AAA family ATPase n=1 Tax=Variovorax sp. J22P240 TaxID=3053514 RepID=UPI0025757B02|nr:AAA family ATPase [Variovorax sp. J22P240]MDL9997253.1 AAA family ATPase [Variovorax sp. J22P240]